MVNKQQSLAKSGYSMGAREVALAAVPKDKPAAFNKLAQGFVAKATEAADFVVSEVNQFINNEN